MLNSIFRIFLQLIRPGSLRVLAEDYVRSKQQSVAGFTCYSAYHQAVNPKNQALITAFEELASYSFKFVHCFFSFCLRVGTSIVGAMEM